MNNSITTIPLLLYLLKGYIMITVYSKLSTGKQQVLFNSATQVSHYPAREYNFSLPIELDSSEFYEYNELTICWQYENDQELFLLTLLKKSLSKNISNKITLLLPYVPYARMDRVETSTDILSLKIFAEQINSLNFDKVVVIDAHSDVSLALINNIVCRYPQVELIENLIKSVGLNKDEILLVYPDGGASKKYAKKLIGLGIPFVDCTKQRDFKTGKIKSLHVNISQDVIDNANAFNHVIIVDDICSRGGTFVAAKHELMRVLPHINENNYYLVVSHVEPAIFDDSSSMKKEFKYVYTTDSLVPQLFDFTNHASNDLESSDNLEELMLKQDETNYVEHTEERLNDVYNEEHYCRVKGNMLVSYLPVQRFFLSVNSKL